MVEKINFICTKFHVDVAVGVWCTQDRRNVVSPVSSDLLNSGWYIRCTASGPVIFKICHCHLLL
jgi:hypothetical protein